MRDLRRGLDLFTDVLDVLERHGFARGDDQHAGRAILLIGDLARIYEGSQDHPSGPSINEMPSASAAPGPPGPELEPGPSVPEDDLDAVTLTRAQVRTVLTTLDIAADWKRDRAEMCTDCADQSCATCQIRRNDAQAFDHLAGQVLDRAASASQPQPGSEPAPAASTHPAADREAGQ